MYAQINCPNKGEAKKKKGKHQNPEESPVYSDVKIGTTGTVMIKVCVEMCHIITLQVITSYTSCSLQSPEVVDRLLGVMRVGNCPIYTLMALWK
ncbi:hypothetical protein EXN66_Car013468 [Channa argus]|uniref:Uncharacterized protein n=1 Tax=Channa argus TaxID=215402 RepID=A0A6G1Q5K8_CHAAH|nr:hypothetical protein EXN66_Car013468 [Channa argus]